MSKILFINGRFLTRSISGVERYAHEVLRCFDQFIAAGRWIKDCELVCLAPPEKIENPGWQHIKLSMIGVSKGNLWEQFDLPLFLRGRWLFSPANIGPWRHQNQIVTMHDANIFAVPEAYTWAFRAKYHFILNQLVQNARLTLTDSRFSQKELAHHLRVSRDRLAVVHLSGNHMLRIDTDESILLRNSISPRSYLLMVASQSPHKNFSRLLEAIKSVNSDIQFVMTGGNFSKIFQQAGLNALPANVKHLGYVSNQELKALYANALGFIFPSLYEGFGLPVLEAMSCGCPVLCSNAASLPEVGGDAVLYFDPLKVDEIAAKIQQFIMDVTLQTELRQKGYLQAAQFQWEKTALATMNLIQTVL